ncbi:hypothetical protein MTO96_005045 [Rhipicephalus appendiculatus]
MDVDAIQLPGRPQYRTRRTPHYASLLQDTAGQSQCSVSYSWSGTTATHSREPLFFNTSPSFPSSSRSRNDSVVQILGMFFAVAEFGVRPGAVDEKPA